MSYRWTSKFIGMLFVSVASKYNVSFWDSLIIASALDNKCTLLYSEDMQHGLLVDNKLKVVNPLD